MASAKEWLKKLFHIHKYTTLKMYPPRPEYNEDNWGFLLKCKCGKNKLILCRYSINRVEEIRSK